MFSYCRKQEARSDEGLDKMKNKTKKQINAAPGFLNEEI